MPNSYFKGDLKFKQVPLFSCGRPSLPFPHPWNYRDPIRILSTYFHHSDQLEGSERHNSFLKIPGFPAIYVTRDPKIIKAITLNTGAKDNQFDRDTMPSQGIARATGKDTLLYANGELWQHQKKLSSSPFRKTTLFQPEQFSDFEQLFRKTALERIEAFQRRVHQDGKDVEIRLEDEIKPVMLEMLSNCFFGTELSYIELREHYVPALETVIDHIVSDTVLNRIGLSVLKLPNFFPKVKKIKAAYHAFEKLTDIVLSTRSSGRGLWDQFKSDAPNEKLRSNIKVFLAGALEATTSYASWAISHLARNPAMQSQVYEEVKGIEDYSPENLKHAQYLGHVLEETLRLSPSLYFLPRQAPKEIVVETDDQKQFTIPQGTHILLDVWHANRHEDHWGVDMTGYSADCFEPKRWENIEQNKNFPHQHFGFGNGPRVCPGKNLGQMEVALVVGAFTKLFEYQAVHSELKHRAGVSTKPADGVLLKMKLRV